MTSGKPQAKRSIPRRMDTPPPLAAGFVRIGVTLLPNRTPTPGEVAHATGLTPEQIGPVLVLPGEALVDVRGDHLRQARNGLDRLGRTRVAGLTWCWLKLHVGRNHGLSMGQFRRLMADADSGPLGKIRINNTHTLIGLQEFRAAAVAERLGHKRINGYASRPELMPSHSAGLGDPAFTK